MEKAHKIKNMKNEKIIVIGAGLCGTLMSMRLSQRGYDVDVYEKRSDPRAEGYEGGRSINLALSDRGLASLAMVGLDDDVRSELIPMYGRMIHADDGSTGKLYKYSGRPDEYINSVSRSGLNIKLLEEADKFDNIDFYFDTECLDVNTDTTTVTIKMDGEIQTLKADVILATDGAGSAARKSFERQGNKMRFDFSVKYLDTGYKELSLPAKADGSWAIDENALHIWPREGFMMIALPNLDGSFTLTLFIPFEGPNSLEQLTTDAEIMTFFQKNFPKLEEYYAHMLQDFHENPTSSLGTIRCYPWLRNKTLLLGDSAHAIVPFYGQGMNCAFEDCKVLDELLDKYEGDWDQVLPKYQEVRKPDTDAIADLAEDNFYEMRDATADPIFNKKRQIELALEQQYPDYYSKYSLVTFREDLPYHKAMAQGRRQNEILMDIAAEVSDVSNVNLQEVLDTVKAKMA